MLATQTVPALQSQLNEAGLDAVATWRAKRPDPNDQLGQRFRRFNQPADISMSGIYPTTFIAANAMQAAAGKSSALADKYENPFGAKPR